MWRSCLARVLVWFVALAGLGLHAMAQTNTGNIYGTVIDDQNNGIPGGSVLLTGPQAPRTTTVDEGGRFRFLRVPGGTYEVTVTMPGFTTAKRENVIVTLGKDTDVGVQLRLSSVSETITVTDTTALLDTRKVTTGATFGKEELQEIPTARDIYALIQQVPGVQLDTVNIAGNASAVAGGPDFISKGSGNVTYQVDGSTITDNTYGNPLGRQNGGTNTFFDYETFDDVEVTTGGSLLELQNPGVQINVVTKRGTNELKGSARFLYASANWQSTNESQEAIDQGFLTNKTRFIREYGGELGGPVVKDKLWLWAAGSRQDISVTTTQPTQADGSYNQTVTLEPWSAKLNWQVSSPNSLNLYFSRSNRIEDGRISSAAVTTRAPETWTNLDIPTNFYKIEDNHVFSASLFASVFANYQGATYDSVPRGGLDAQIDYYDGVWHNSWNYFFAKDPQKQANLQVSKFFNTGNINHEIKFSFNYRNQIADSATGLPGDQLQGQEYSSSAYAAVTRGVRTTYTTNYWTGTLGDTLTVGNLTVNAGLRYDLQQSRNLPGQSFGNTVFPELLPTVYFHGADDWQFEYGNVQPRVSATYALGEKKNTLVRASYASYADQLGYISYYGSGVPISNGYYYYWDDINGDHHVDRNEVLIDEGVYSFYNDIDPATLPNIPNQIDPNFKTPFTAEITAGIDQQIFNDFAVSGTFTYRNTTHLQASDYIGANVSTYDFIGNVVGTAVYDNASNPFVLDFTQPCIPTQASPAPCGPQAYALELPEQPTGSVFYNRVGASQRYFGAEFSAVKRLSNRWMLRGSFGWQSFKQYITADSIVNPNNLWAQGGNNQNGVPAVGFSTKDNVFINANWQFNVSGLYQGPWGINLGANFFGRQGYPMPYYVRVRTRDVNNDRVNLLIGSVDSVRLENLYNLDLRLERAFQIGPVTASLAAELFNVANANTVLQRSAQAGTWDVRDYDPDDPTAAFSQNDNFNYIQETLSPRIVRLGVRVSF